MIGLLTGEGPEVQKTIDIFTHKQQHLSIDMKTKIVQHVPRMLGTNSLVVGDNDCPCAVSHWLTLFHTALFRYGNWTTIMTFGPYPCKLQKSIPIFTYTINIDF